MSDDIRYDLLETDLRELRDLVRQLATQAPVGYTQVTEGNFDIMSEEGLRVIGTALIAGVLDVLGKISVRGLGILEVLSLIDLLGSMRVRGGGDITLDGGKIQTGNIRIEDGKIYVGDNIVIDSATNTIRIGQDIVIDGATGVIRIGEMILDPSENGGTIKFPRGGEVYAADGALSLYSSSTGAYVTLAGDAAEIHGPGLHWIRIDNDGIQFVGLGTITETDSGGHKPGAMFVLPSGRARRVVADTA